MLIIRLQFMSQVSTIVISYLVMFIYISVSLRESFSICTLRGLLVESRLLLGVVGILVVLTSVTATFQNVLFSKFPNFKLLFVPGIIRSRTIRLLWPPCDPNNNRSHSLPRPGRGSGQYFHHGATLPTFLTPWRRF